MAAAVSDLDVVALTSRNEGTPVALIEASAAARLRGPGAAGRTTPSTARMGWTSRVVEDRNASSGFLTC